MKVKIVTLGSCQFFQLLLSQGEPSSTPQLYFLELLIFLLSFSATASITYNHKDFLELLRHHLSSAPSDAVPGPGNKPWESVCGRVNEFRSVFATNTASLSIAAALKSAGPRLESGHLWDNAAD